MIPPGYKRAVSAIRNSRLHLSVPLVLKIRNRAFAMPADGMIHIAPYGEHPHWSGVIQVIDEAAVDAMVSDFQNRKRDPKFPGVQLDYDHKSDSDAQYTNAAGWISELQKRSDGLWALPDWSRSGSDAVTGGEFKFVSPVWIRRDCEKIGEDRLRPLKLDKVALTNDPNLKGLHPLTK